METMEIHTWRPWGLVEMHGDTGNASHYGDDAYYFEDYGFQLLVVYCPTGTLPHLQQDWWGQWGWWGQGIVDLLESTAAQHPHFILPHSSLCSE